MMTKRRRGATQRTRGAGGNEPSALKGFLDIPHVERMIFFLLSPFYPFQVAFLELLERAGNKLWRYVLQFVLLAVGQFVSFKWFDLGSGLFRQELATAASVLVLNVVLLFVILTMDLPWLVRNEVDSAAKARVSEWLQSVIGHKLWSGDKTHQLMQHLVANVSGLGRAKWLLVNFLREDIERNILVDQNPDTGKPLYEIMVIGWDLPTYSRFLAENLANVESSIYWLVDDIDFLCELLPMYVVEVLVSIGACMNTQVASLISDLEPKESAEKLFFLLEAHGLQKYCLWRKPSGGCGRNRLAMACGRAGCPETGIDFKGRSRAYDLDLVWAAIVRATLGGLTTGTASRGKLSVRRVNIRYSRVRDEYFSREQTACTEFLPHVRGFRQVPAERKRFLYLGEGNGPDEARDNILDQVVRSKGVAYLDAVGPCVSAGVTRESGSRLIRGWLAWSEVPGDPSRILILNNEFATRFWGAIAQPEVRRLFVRWGWRLLRDSSGGADVVGGVLVSDPKKALSYHFADHRDVGVYDGRLVICARPSADPALRDIRWRVFKERVDPLLSTYFGDGSGPRVLSSKEVEEVVVEALVR